MLLLLCRSVFSEHEFDSVCSPKFRREGDQIVSCLVVLCVNAYRHGKLCGRAGGRLLVSEWRGNWSSWRYYFLRTRDGRALQGTVRHGRARFDCQFTTTIAVQVTRQKDEQTAISDVLRARFCRRCILQITQTAAVTRVDKQLP
jgi:hypothetical protein